MNLSKIDAPEYSLAWVQGYTYYGPKSDNPYAAGQPWLSEFPSKDSINKFCDWDNGWEARER